MNFKINKNNLTGYMKSVFNDFFVDWEDTRNIINNNKQNNIENKYNKLIC